LSIKADVSHSKSVDRNCFQSLSTERN